MQQFKVGKANHGTVAKLTVSKAGLSQLSNEVCQEMFKDRCAIEGLDIDGPVLISIQRSLLGTEHDEAEAAAYVVRAKSKTKS